MLVVELPPPDERNGERAGGRSPLPAWPDRFASFPLACGARMQKIPQASETLRMPTGEMISTLSQHPERLPEWLEQSQPQFDREIFFGSRTVYYPGPHRDFDPVKLCAKANAAHTFFYVDDGVSLDDIHKLVHGVNGYEVEHEEELTEAVLLPAGWTSHVHKTDLTAKVKQTIETDFKGIYVSLKRVEHHDQSRTAKCLALLYVVGDGHIAYDAFYCQQDGTPVPYLIVVQDHGGMALNHSRFERGGLLERLAYQRCRYPEWLLIGSKDTIGESYEPWDGYTDTGVAPEPQGAVKNPRKLYRREEDSPLFLTRQSRQVQRNETGESTTRPTLIHEVHDILQAQGNHWMRLKDVADRVNERARYQSTTSSTVTTRHIFDVWYERKQQFERDKSRIRCKENG